MTTHNKDKIIAAAMQAGLAFDSEEFPEIWQTYMHVGRAEIERFYAIAFEAGRSSEREDCAKVCDRYKDKSDIQPEDCAFAIRARSTK